MKIESQPVTISKNIRQIDPSVAPVTEYYKSTSSKIPQQGTWSVTMPLWETGYSLWKRTKYTYTNGTVMFTTPIMDTTWNAISDYDASKSWRDRFNELMAYGDVKGMKADPIDDAMYFNADYINAGVLSAERMDLNGIAEFFSKDPDNGSTYVNGGWIKTGKIEDVKGNFSLNMNTGDLVMKNGSFSGDVTSSNLTATGGTIGGVTIGSNSLSSSGFKLTSDGKFYSYGNTNLSIEEGNINYDFKETFRKKVEMEIGPLYEYKRGSMTGDALSPLAIRSKTSSSGDYKFATIGSIIIENKNGIELYRSLSYDDVASSNTAEDFFIISTYDANLLISARYPYHVIIWDIYNLKVANNQLQITTALGTYYCSIYSSDERQKKNIKDSEANAIDAIRAMEFKSFDWIESGEHQKVGVIAQQLENIDEGLALKVEQEDGSYRYQVNHPLMTSYIAKAVQELIDRVESLENEVSKLKGEN